MQTLISQTKGWFAFVVDTQGHIKVPVLSTESRNPKFPGAEDPSEHTLSKKINPHSMGRKLGYEFMAFPNYYNVDDDHHKCSQQLKIITLANENAENSLVDRRKPELGVVYGHIKVPVLSTKSRNPKFPGAAVLYHSQLTPNANFSSFPCNVAD
ncbi:hypothetical protein HUJ04_010522 [Dendroctonus ponderosae]|nr:hypothetical protein HUJ04_010522 [Dendroctonus ponderosae]